MDWGRNLFSSKQTLIERFGIPTMKNEIGRKSKLMEELADIDENKEEILARDGKLPAADIAVDSYQFQSGALPVTVSNIRNVKGEIQSLQLAYGQQKIKAIFSGFRWSREKMGTTHC